MALVKAGANVSAKGIYRKTALRGAKSGGHQDIVKVLENAGATETTKRETPPLVRAAQLGEYGHVKRLLQQGSDVNTTDYNGMTGLMVAARRGDLLFVKAFIDAGARVNIKSDWLGSTALLWAVAENHIDVAKVLLASGADPNIGDDHGKAAIVHAEDIRTVKLLLNNGAKVNKRDSVDATPLMQAARKNNIPKVKLLMARGADVNAHSQSFGNALHWAAEAGHTEMVKLLIAHGADVNATNTTKTTPLMKATEKGQWGLVRVLVQANAEVRAEDFCGKTAVDVARLNNHKSIAEFLTRTPTPSGQGKRQKRSSETQKRGHTE